MKKDLAVFKVGDHVIFNMEDGAVHTANGTLMIIVEDGYDPTPYDYRLKSSGNSYNSSALSAYAREITYATQLAILLLGPNGSK